MSTSKHRKAHKNTSPAFFGHTLCRSTHFTFVGMLLNSVLRTSTASPDDNTSSVARAPNRAGAGGCRTSGVLSSPFFHPLHHTQGLSVCTSVSRRQIPNSTAATPTTVLRLT